MSSVYVLCRGASQNRTPVGVYASLEAAQAAANWLPTGSGWKQELVRFDDWTSYWHNADLMLPFADWADIFEVPFNGTPPGADAGGPIDLGYTERVLAEEVATDDNVFVSWEGADHRGRVHQVGFRVGSRNVAMTSTSWSVEVPHDFPLHRRPRG